MSGYPGKLNDHAKLTLVERVCAQGVSVAEAARMANVSRQTAHRWLRRYRHEGIAGLRARSRRPLHFARALPPATVAAIIAARRQSGRGPQWIAWQLALSPSTVHRVLQRARLHRLALLDRVTRTPVRYEHDAPGEMLHLDVKRLARVPRGGGRHFDPLWRHDRRTGGHGFDLLHVAIDDHSRYLYVEALADQTAATTAAFLERAIAHFASHGVRVRRILTDNGLNYRSRLVRRVARRHGIAVKHTRPYRPQTNGKAERVIQTLLREWAYQRAYTSNAERLRALRRYVREYNTRRPHAALAGRRRSPGFVRKPCLGTRHVGTGLQPVRTRHAPSMIRAGRVRHRGWPSSLPRAPTNEGAHDALASSTCDACVDRLKPCPYGSLALRRTWMRAFLPLGSWF